MHCPLDDSLLSRAEFDAALMGGRIDKPAADLLPAPDQDNNDSLSR
ncbi:hypothetical protein ACIA8C_29160 [Nocardia sp. NPDC051321]